jgi:hypothetical protein
MRILLVVYKLKDQMIYADLYTNGTIVDKKEVIHHVEEILLNAKFKKKKCQIVYKDQIPNKLFKITDKIFVSKKFVNQSDRLNELEEIDELVIPNNLKKLIKSLMSDPEGDKRKLYYTKTPPDSPKSSSTLTTQENNSEENLLQPTKQDSGVELKETSKIYDLILDSQKEEKKEKFKIEKYHSQENKELISHLTPDDKQQQKSEGLSLEVKENIKMLISISYLKEGGFYIRNDMAILIKPVGHAYGDFLTNRQGHHFYKRDGFQNRFIRLSLLDVAE